MSSARKKIVIIPAWYPHPEQPVAGIFVHDQAQCLASRHDVTVISPDYADKPHSWHMEEFVDGVRVRRCAPAAVKIWTRLVHRIRPPNSTEVYYRKFWDAARQGFEHHFREHGKPDVIHAHVVLPAGWIACQLGARWRVPVALTEHSGPFTVHLVTAWQRKLTRQTLLGVDRCFAVSPALAGIIERCFPEVKPQILGNVVRTDFFTPTPTIPNDKFRFLSIALLTEGKGIQHLLEAAAILRARGLERFEIVIGGDGPYRATLEKLTDHWGIRSSCRFLGLLNRTQVRDQMRQCDAFVLPSLSETFCLVLCEAMACGKPVLSTQSGGPEFTVTKDTGMLVPVGRPYELADAMVGFLRCAYGFSPDTIRQSVVARFGEAAFVGQLESIYEEMRGHTAPRMQAV
jgi:glycosyltransferase involved in cell wall biosynthesis